MNWLMVAIIVAATTVKDILQAVAMKRHGEIHDFRPGALGKVLAIRRALDDRALGVELEVDGGIKPDNAARVAAAGATVLVAGSAIFEDPDGPAAALRKFKGAIRR